ncbi:ABC transporter substrate-binding protein [Streptomyces sp. NPDC001941]|uniref:ABC transporter substrate-binding protein n=1 Tax=Streptomyces sp. NPDC001941 TaxID=3154659 RepID=UPI0033347CC2
MRDQLLSRGRLAAVALATGALLLSACSSGGGGGGGGKGEGATGPDKNKAGNYRIGNAADSKGPAPAVKGAKSGGTVNVLQLAAFNYLDPAEIYYSDTLTNQLLYNRSLTGYKIDEKGKVTLVGDLATDPGRSSDGGKTWTYTLKSGLAWEDGSKITSADVRQSVERLYASWATDGPLYVPQWLSGDGQDFRKALPDGPYKGKHLPASVLDTPDEKTVVFHFRTAHPDAPYAMAMPNIGAVPSAPGKDPGEPYNKRPLASGPYKFGEIKTGKSISMVKNTQWKADTDPIRHQYVDGFQISFGSEEAETTRRLLADRGSDKTAMSFSDAVTTDTAQSVLDDPGTKSRSFREVQPYEDYMAINTRRVKDKRVREAIAYALPSAQILAQVGGKTGGVVAGNLMSPSLAGWQDTDPFGKKKYAGGDTAKAKQLLKEAGAEGYELVYAYRNDEIYQKVSVVVAQALEKAGFKVEKKEIDPDNFRDEISKVDKKIDIHRASWGADWPVGSTVVPPLFDGRQISDGSQNYWLLNDPKVNAEIDRINKVQDIDAAAPEWFKLSEKILTDDVPAVPIFYNTQYSLWGSGLGGVKYHSVYGTADPTGVYVK